MKIIIDRIIEHLSASTDLLSSLAGLGTKQPSRSSSLPTIVMALTLNDNHHGYIGRFVGSGFRVVRNTATIAVQSGAAPFAENLCSLRLWPLPLKRNPSSAEKEFTEQDVTVRNVTTLSHPVSYRMVEEPTEVEEYRLDVPGARIVFGKAQKVGEKIEVAHWTVAWRDDIRAEPSRGVVSLEIWASSASQADEISRKIQDRLQSDDAALRQRGFLTFRPAGLGAIENRLQSPPVGSAFAVWKQKLEYRFIFEAEEGGQLSSGTRIQRIDVDMNRHLVESFSVPESI